MSSQGEVSLATASRKFQERKLFRLLRDAASNVPMYERLYAGVDFHNKELSLPQLLSRLPIISKTGLTSTPLEDRLNRRFPRATLFEESTTGSTGQPFTLCVDRSYMRRRNLRFLHGLLSVGFRPWQRLMLLTDRYTDGTRTRLNRFYVSVEQPTSSILTAYQQTRPHVLYGLLTPLRLLAESLPSDAPRPKLVVSTAEMLDPGSRRDLETAFGCPVSDFYGLTEMGLVAWQRSGAERYIMSPNSVLTELFPDSGGEDRYRMIMTNLDLYASPIIRFDTGDLAKVRWVNGEPYIESIEGRHVDTIVKRDGSQLSPYRITDALRDVVGLRRFRITQRELTEILVELEVADDLRAGAARSAQSILGELLGEGLNLEIRFRSELIPAGARKFRPVESRVARR